MRNDTRARFVAQTTAALSATAMFRPLPARAQTKTKLRLAIIPSEISAAVYFAKELGWFEAADIDAEVTPLRTGAAIVEALLSSAIDIGITNPMSLALTHEKGLPIIILAPVAMHDARKVTDGLLTVAETSSIHTAKDLTGKTIAVSGIGNIGHIAVRNWIDKNGGDSKTQKYLELSLPEMGPAVVAGRIDAANMDAGGIARSGHDKLRTLASTFDSYAKLFVASYWAASTDWIAKNEPTAKQFVSIMKRASAWGNTHPHEAHGYFAKNSSYTREQLEAGVDPTFATTLTPAMLQPVLDVAAKYDVIHPVAARDLISPLAL